MPQVRQGTLDAAVTPRWVLLRHAQDELFDFLGDTRASKLFALLAAIELVCYQSLVPTQEGIGRGEGGELFEALTAQWIRQCGETAALGVGKTEPAAAVLGFEDAILLLKVGDHLLLVPIDPAGDHRDQDVKDHGLSSGWKCRRHCSAQYSPNLRSFKGVESAVYFNHTTSWTQLTSSWTTGQRGPGGHA